MVKRALFLCCLVAWPQLVLAGPNEGGVLLVHANPSLTYTTDQASYCGMSGLSACSLAVTSVPWDPETTTVFYVLAAFPEGSQPRLKAVSWGVEWDAAVLVIAAHGSCADFDVPDGTWPASGTGIGQSFTETRTGPLTELYWIAGYAYGAGEDTTSFRAVPHPAQGAVMVDDAVPPNEDEIAAFGWLGFGITGYATCPGGTDGNNGGDSWYEEQGDDGGLNGEEGEEQCEYTGCLRPALIMRIWNDSVNLPPSATTCSIECVSVSDSCLAMTLASHAPLWIRKLVPTACYADTTIMVPGLGVTVRAPSLAGLFSLTLADTSDTEALLADLQVCPSVATAERNVGWGPCAEPSDTDYPTYQWCHRNFGQLGGTPDMDMDTNEAWDNTTGSEDIVVAILDTGMNPEHPDLNARTIIGDMGWGCRPNSPSWCVPQHGMNVAGVLGASTDNNYGIAGTDWRCTLLNEFVPSLDGDDFISAIGSAVGRGADVINLSYTYRLSGWGDDSSARIPITNGFYAGTNTVASANGHGDPSAKFPAAFDPVVVAVGAFDRNGEVPSWSCGGPFLDVVAPGVDLRTLSISGFEDAVGTSLSAPLVAGAVSLMKALASESGQTITDRDAEEVLCRTADDMFPPGFDEASGYGRVNIGRALDFVHGHLFWSWFTEGALVVQEWPRVKVAWIGVPVPGIIGNVCLVRRYDVECTAVFLGGGNDAVFWPLLAGTRGMLFEDPMRYDFPSAELVSHGEDYCTWRTSVYRVFDVGGHDLGWWPCQPSEARVAFRMVVPRMTSGVPDEIRSPSGSCALRVVGGNPAGRTFGAPLRLEAVGETGDEVVAFDATGRRLLTLGWIEAGGEGSFAWMPGRPGGSGAGVYFLSLVRSNRPVVTRKVVVLN